MKEVRPEKFKSASQISQLPVMLRSETNVGATQKGRGAKSNCDVRVCLARQLLKEYK